jgi:hypothetical protein
MAEPRDVGAGESKGTVDVRCGCDDGLQTGSERQCHAVEVFLL